MRRYTWVLTLSAVAALPALALALNRIIQPDLGASIRLVAFTPLAVPWYAGCLLLVALVLLRVPAARTPRVVVPALCLGLLTGLHLAWIAPGMIGARPAAEGESSTVMTLNLRHGGADPGRVLDLVEERKVDVLVLQEITGSALRALKEDGLDRLLPHAAGEPGPDAEGTMVFARDQITGVRPIGTTFGGWSVSVDLPGGKTRLQAVHGRAHGRSEAVAPGLRSDRRDPALRPGGPDRGRLQRDPRPPPAA